MPDVEILANGDARKVLSNPGRSKGLPMQIHDNLVKKLSDVAGKVEPKGAGFYGIDLGQGYRALFTYTNDMKPVMLYIGDHKGYDDISAAIKRDATATRSSFLKETPEAITVSSKKAVRSLSVESFRESFLKTTGKDAVLAEEAAKVASRSGKFLKGGAKVAGKAAGKIFKPAAAVLVAAEVVALTSKAEAAELAGKLPPQAVAEYKDIMAGQGATFLDPTFIGGELLVQNSYIEWAKKYVKDPQLEAELRPSSLMEALGMPMPTVSETRRSEFYQKLPDKDDAGLPPDIRELVKAKQEIKQAVHALVKEKSGFWASMAAAGSGGYNNDAVLYPEQMKAIEQAQEKFNALYAQKLESGAVESWSNRASGSRPAQTQPGRQ
ncbi:MAG: hypothetical protein ACAH80_16330 [Alphaproteobacteria bacterium]